MFNYDYIATCTTCNFLTFFVLLRSYRSPHKAICIFNFFFLWCVSLFSSIICKQWVYLLWKTLRTSHHQATSGLANELWRRGWRITTFSTMKAFSSVSAIIRFVRNEASLLSQAEIIVCVYASPHRHPLHVTNYMLFRWLGLSDLMSAFIHSSINLVSQSI